METGLKCTQSYELTGYQKTTKKALFQLGGLKKVKR